MLHMENLGQVPRFFHARKMHATFMSIYFINILFDFLLTKNYNKHS